MTHFTGNANAYFYFTDCYYYAGRVCYARKTCHTLF